MTNSITEALSANRYPGRGIVIGMSADGRRAVSAYFIMGRSENSRNRVFVADGDGVLIRPHDPARVSDPSLIIYRPLAVLGNTTVVTNGDQTDTIAEELLNGGSFEQALRRRTYEPDTPNYTPRISGLIERTAGGFSYRLSILKRLNAESAACLRQFFEYEPRAGIGHFIHTYNGDGEPLPSFCGEPRMLAINDSADIEAYAAALWQSLNADNRVALVLRYISLADGSAQTAIINRHRV
ncbi:MAG: IMP cyclohydrolase [Bacillota bacterium]|nr:IMP cyclohydrolase [Bacillota bacterium]